MKTETCKGLGYMAGIAQGRRLSFNLFVVPQDAFLRKAEKVELTEIDKKKKENRTIFIASYSSTNGSSAALNYILNIEIVTSIFHGI